jgi:putative membrane protein
MWMPIIWCLALGGLYEILEGAVVGIFFPEQGANFLGIQGDFWDPQKDICLAGLGASVFSILLYIVKRYKIKSL